MNSETKNQTFVNESDFNIRKYVKLTPWYDVKQITQNKSYTTSTTTTNNNNHNNDNDNWNMKMTLIPIVISAL